MASFGLPSFYDPAHELKDSKQPKARTKTKFIHQNYDYFLVLDFEANGDHKIIKPMEIIEFPVLKVSAKTFEVESKFHHYVEPAVNKLCDYCTQVTGITQEMVDGKPRLDEILKRLDEWMEKEGLLQEHVKSIFITCGDWDLKTQLPRETAWHGYTLPRYCRSWINIKRPFVRVTGLRASGMMGMLRDLRIPHTGRHHSGIDDCKNIAKIVRELAARGHIYEETGSV